ncbi:MAG TPA: hypothetical protein VNC84_06485 [Gammaproteobacteria bacterium]|jgi:hypothetical protein|nr:hypothetical protein [Gammaproteobacteria bacterium]
MSGTRKIGDPQGKDAPLLRLSTGCLQAIGALLSTKSVLALASTCTATHTLFEKDGQQRRRTIKRLLYHVVKDEQVEAEEMVNRSPELLTIKANVLDRAGREIEGTALQIALGAENVKYLDGEYNSFERMPREFSGQNRMAKMLEKHFRKLPNSEEIIIAQIAQQFPAGWQEAENARVKRDNDALAKVVEAIEQNCEGYPVPCEDALQVFKDYLGKENKERDVIRTGKHFNMRMLCRAELFRKNNRKKAAMMPWLYKVIKEIHRYVPDSYKNLLPDEGCETILWEWDVLEFLLDKKDCDLLDFIQRTHVQRPEECCSMDCSAPGLP